MKLARRQFLHWAVAAATLPALPRTAWSQAYPARPVRILCGFPGGSSQDIVARIIAQWLSERFAEPVIIDNRPGPGGNIAVEAVVNAPPDGYTLLMTGPNNAVNATLYDNLKFNFIRDIAPVAGINREPNVIVVNPSVPAKTVPEFIAYAKANPGKINMASAGSGTPGHVNGELFKMMSGTTMVHLPYRGNGPALTDLLGGQVQVMFPDMPSSLEYIRTGNLRPLAVTAAMRSDALPDIPTLSEFLPGYEASGWFGLGAPRTTRTEIVDKLNQEINTALADPKFKARIIELGGTTLSLSPAEFGKLIADETEKWGKVVRAANLKPE